MSSLGIVTWGNRASAYTILAVLILSLVANTVQAQRGRRGEKPKYITKSISGKLHSMAPARGIIRIVTDDNQPWEITITEKTDVHIQGEGGAELLRPGMIVRFYAKLARKSKGIEPVQEFVVVSPDANFRPGIFEDEEDEPLAEPANEEGAEPNKPDAESADANEAKSLDDADATATNARKQDKTQDATSSSKRRRQRTKKPRAIPAKRYWISGQIRSIKKKKLVVLAGDEIIRVEMDESTRVVVEAKDLRLARRKDHVAIRGGYYDNKLGFMKAYSVDVTLATEDKKPSEKPLRKTKTTKQEKKGKPLDLDELQKEEYPPKKKAVP